MEKKFYTDEFEEFLREKTEGHKMYPSEKVWNNIQQELHGNERRRWFILIPALLLLLGTGAYFLTTNTTNRSAFTASENSQANSQLTENGEINSSNGGKQPANTVDENRLNQASGSSYSNANLLRTTTHNQKRTRSARINNNSLATAITQSNNQQVIAGNIDENERISAEPSAAVKNDVLAAVPEDTDINPADNNLTANTSNSAGKEESEQKKDELKLTSNELTWESFTLQHKAAKRSKWSWSFYVSPNSSYRKLEDDGTKFISGTPTIAVSPAISQDVNDVVSHKPSLGFEAGTGINYEVIEGVTLKTGLQFNYNKYYIKAYSYQTETALIAADPYNRNNVYGVSSYRNFGGYTPVTLQNNYFQVSAPVGVDIRLASSKGFYWYAGASVQPTYNILFNTYLISADKKNYISANDFLRKWNLNTNFETGVGFGLRNGSLLQIAPQVRYQVKPSYISELPIKEFLLEYGLKFTLKKGLR